MKFFKACAVLIILSLGVLTAYSNTAVIGTMWKQIGTIVYSADDVTAVDMSGVSTTLGDVTADSINLGSGSVTVPSMILGANDLGIYEVSDDVLGFAANNNLRMKMGGGYLEGAVANRFAINYNATTSTTVPHYTFNFDVDTGLGRGAADQLSLIAGGVEGQRITTTGSTINNTLTFASMTTVFGDYSAINNMNQILCDATAGDVDIHIVSAAGVKGTRGNVKKVDVSANSCIIDPAGAETIDWLGSFALSTRGESVNFFSDDTNLLID